MQLHEFLAVTHDKERLLNYLIDHNLLISEIECPWCNNILNINRNSLLFRCYRTSYEKNKHKKRVKKICNFQTSAKVNTWFSQSNLSLETICRLTAYFIMLRSPRHKFLCTELQLSEHSIVDWISFC